MKDPFRAPGERTAARLAKLEVRLQPFERFVAAPPDVLSHGAGRLCRRAGCQRFREILMASRRAREATVARLDAIDTALFERMALHPRLKVAMRLVDALDFTAHHDDYHLATITALLRRPDSGAPE